MNNDILVKALEKIRDTAKSWEGRGEAPYWDLGYMADAALKRFNQAIATDALQCPECKQNGDSGMNFCAFCGRQLWHR